MRVLLVEDDDAERREVTVDGAVVPLTRKEFNLLAVLARQPAYAA